MDKDSTLLSSMTPQTTWTRFQSPDSETPTVTPGGTDRNIAVAVFLISLAYLYLFRRYTGMEPDEGIILQGAERVLHGQTPYRDFFSFYTPGSYYLTAAGLKLFGDTLSAARTALAAGASLVSALTYLLARRVCSRGVALAAAALATSTALPYRDLVLHNWDSTLWAMLTLYAGVRYLEAPGGRRAFALGSLAAVTVLFEQSKGAGLVLGLGLGFAVLAIAYQRCSGTLLNAEDQANNPVVRSRLLQGSGQAATASPARSAAASPLRHLPAMSVGFACPFLLTIAWFAHQHAVPPMMADWLWPLHHYSRANSVRYGYQNWSEASRATLFGGGNWGRRMLVLLVVAPCFLIPVLPLIAVAAFARISGRTLRALPGQEPGPRTRHYLLVSGVIAGLLLSVVAGRADILHFVYLAPMLYLVLAWILDGHDVPSSLFRACQPALRILIAICFFLLASALAVTDLTARASIETRRGEVKAPATDQVLPRVQSQVAAGSTIFVYPYLPLYYYLTDTFAPGPYDYLQPGMHTPQQQAEMVRDVEADHTPMALYEYAFSEKISNSWPNTPLESIARDPVADFLLTHYRICSVLKSASGDRFLLMMRKDLACPTGAP
jgi:hypothetical protein